MQFALVVSGDGGRGTVKGRPPMVHKGTAGRTLVRRLARRTDSLPFLCLIYANPCKNHLLRLMSERAICQRAAQVAWNIRFYDIQNDAENECWWCASPNHSNWAECDFIQCLRVFSVLFRNPHFGLAICKHECWWSILFIYSDCRFGDCLEFNNGHSLWFIRCCAYANLPTGMEICTL